MDFLTRQLGKIVFDVDLANIPDETKTKRGRRALGENFTFLVYFPAFRPSMILTSKIIKSLLKHLDFRIFGRLLYLNFVDIRGIALVKCYLQYNFRALDVFNVT